MLLVPPLIDYRALLTSKDRLVVSKVWSYEPFEETDLKSTHIDPITPKASHQASQQRSTKQDRTPNNHGGTDRKRPDLANGCTDPPQTPPYTPLMLLPHIPLCRTVYTHIKVIHTPALAAPIQNVVTCLAAIRIVSSAKGTPMKVKIHRVDRVTINFNVTYLRLTPLSVPR